MLANAFILTPKENVEPIEAGVEAIIDLKQGIASGARRLAKDAGLSFKVLGLETTRVTAKLREFWEIAREEITVTPVSAPLFWR